MMKKVFFTLIMLVGVTTVGFSQDGVKVAVTEGKTELMESKTSGEYSFTLPGDVTSEQVKKNSNYYTSNFTVDFDNKSKIANITMIKNDQQSRYVIVRFLAACGVQHVEVDGQSIVLHDFIEQYLK